MGGETNFYLSAVDDLLRTGPDGPTIGLLPCESHNSPIAGYAVRDIAKPIGVSTYRVTRQLPKPLRDEIPSIEDLQGVVQKLRMELHEPQGKQIVRPGYPANQIRISHGESSSRRSTGRRQRLH
jgi:hypothetical protein